MLITTLTLIELVTTVLGAPSYQLRSEQEKYLMRFAHLGELNPDPGMAALQADPNKQFEMAVKSFQRFAGVPITGVIDERTRIMMEKPRCGVPDLMSVGSIARRKRRYAATDGETWKSNPVTYRFLNFSPDLQDHVIRSEFQRAFETWSNVSSLNFREASGKLVDIEISFARRDHGDKGPFDGEGGTLAHAYFPARDYIGGDAHFDEDEYWTTGQPAGTNIYQVAVHELGHSLGLGHSDVKGAVMAPFYSGYDPNFRLHDDDIRGIQHLYGRRPPPTRATTPRTTTTVAPPTRGPLSRICVNAAFDAIDVIDGVIHAFRGDIYLELGDNGRIQSGSLKKIRDTWPQLPSNLDAVLSVDPEKGPVYFFKNQYYWVYNKSNIARPLSTARTIRTGFPGVPDRVDAAFVWSGNGQIYFVKDGYTYRYRDSYYSGYSVWPLSSWRDLPQRIDAAFSHRQRTYFFSGPHYYVFDDQAFRAGEQQATSEWLDCCSVRLAEMYQMNIAPHHRQINSVLLLTAWLLSIMTVF